MAAPSKTSRTTPTGYPMKDGFRSLIVLSNIPGATIWEKMVTFSGREGGEPIPFSSMHNTTWHTERARQLKKLTPITMVCSYDGMTFANLDGQVNVEQTITQHFPSGNWCAFYGYLRSVMAQQNEEGKQPDVQIVIQPTAWDPTNNVEAGPAYGTGT